ncbi:MAG: hypothetical protein WCG93_13975 [Paludibacter sp.]
MKKNNSKIKAIKSNFSETRPELFDFYSYNGRNISLILKNENVKTGRLSCVCTDGTIILEISCTTGIAHTETALFDVSEVILLDN